MFFDISAKSQVNTFSINENYAGLVLASDINRLSCSTDKNSMNDNIFFNNSGNIYNSGSVRNYVDSFKTVIGDFNFSKIIFFKDAIVCCISIPCIQEERKNFSFIYNGRSILFVDYDNFLTDIFSNIIEENINEIDFSSGDCIFLPGGMPGTTNLGACEKLADEIVEYNSQGKLLAAICAAPTVFSNLGLLKDKNATSYPSFEDQMECNNYGGGVVRDGNFITGKGLGVALEMGLEIISYLVDEETAGEVAKAIQYDGVK